MRMEKRLKVLNSTLIVDIRIKTEVVDDYSTDVDYYGDTTDIYYPTLVAVTASWGGVEVNTSVVARYVPILTPIEDILEKHKLIEKALKELESKLLKIKTNMEKIT